MKVSAMTDSPALRVADLPQTRPTPFALQPRELRGVESLPELPQQHA